MKNKKIILFLALILIFDFNLIKKFHLNESKIRKIINSYNPDYFIYIKKKKFKLFVINSNGSIIKIFNIAIGKKKNFGRKIYQGDKGTPEGLYFITEILISTAPTNSLSYKKLKKINSVYFKAKDGFHKWGKPWEDLGRDAYGKAFYRLSYPNQEDIKHYKKLLREGKIPKNKNGKYVGLGSGIAIHGTNDPPSIGHMISSGCIRMLNDDILLLRHYIKVGTPVYIEK